MPEGSDYKERNPRGQGVRITKADVRLHNPTIGCPGCAAIADKRKAENHSESCRARFVEFFQKTEKGRKRLEEANQRIERVDSRKKKEKDQGRESAVSVFPRLSKG